MSNLSLILIGILVLCQSCKKDDAIVYENNDLKNPYNVILAENYYHTTNETYQSTADICLWMLKENNIANWLGRYDFELYEPINALWIDYTAKSIDEAQNNVSVFLEKSGFVTRYFSSSGYLTTINSFWIVQFPPGMTWSDNANPLVENNHARVFASYKVNHSSNSSVYYTTGSFSRESAITHDFISFDAARDQLTLSDNWVEENEMILSNIYNSCSTMEECQENKFLFSTIDHSGIRIFALFPVQIHTPLHHVR